MLSVKTLVVLAGLVFRLLWRMHSRLGYPDHESNQHDGRSKEATWGFFCALDKAFHEVFHFLSLWVSSFVAMKIHFAASHRKNTENHFYYVHADSINTNTKTVGL